MCLTGDELLLEIYHHLNTEDILVILTSFTDTFIVSALNKHQR